MIGGFCVVCGRTDRPIEDGLCADCFAERTPLVRAPERPAVVLCPTCGARLVRQHWEGRGRPTILGAADLVPLLEVHPEVGIRRVDWTDESQHPLLRTVVGEVHLRFRGSERTERVALTVKIEHRTCPVCSRRAGHFYTATIQLRASEESPRERAPERRARLWQMWESVLPSARGDWREALSWSEERPGGWDIFLLDTLAARSLSRLLKVQLGARITESATLWGRKNGQDVYRVTFCVRLPYSAPGGPRAGASGRNGPAERAPRKSNGSLKNQHASQSPDVRG
ncbi:MAG TPA: 60S ribosomal export protein NMD3 [Thermoplasmata archaeon]|nr:60S ribosomal export protein NMD3 [Thermoplasmata archaeon]